ncbi:signal protein [Cavenderia fasciculata]|uniref:Signal protein n=1 Tax=Cavenderia fasciculata TaxID=261658 RepID=F4PW23_CACFS|nr:signal protein [Cavenderia fasciculata]EGG20187.1 signal protein [Cavenderia fasciculata]|eukprot:XP_004367170.1 signal protein [Cavenderia fasciculata]
MNEFYSKKRKKEKSYELLSTILVEKSLVLVSIIVALVNDQWFSGGELKVESRNAIKFVIVISNGDKINFQTDLDWGIVFGSQFQQTGKMLDRSHFTYTSQEIYFNFKVNSNLVDQSPNELDSIFFYPKATDTTNYYNGQLTVPSFIYEAKNADIGATSITFIGYGIGKPISGLPTQVVLSLLPVGTGTENATAQFKSLINSTAFTTNVPSTIKSGRLYNVLSATVQRPDFIYLGENITFSFNPPTISTIVWNTNSNFYTITGTNYYPGVQAATDLKLFVDGQLVPTPFTQINDKNMIVYAPPILTVGTHQLKLDLNDNPGPISQLSVKPIVTFVSSAPKAGGEVTIKGLFFNRTRNDGSNTNIVVLLGTEPCSMVKSPIDSNTLIVCMLQGAKGLVDQPVKVTIEQLDSNLDIKFTQGIPMIASCSQTPGLVTCQGYNFNNPSTNLKLPNGTVITVTSSDNQLSFDFTNLVGLKNGPIQVLSEFRNSTPYPISFIPLIKSVSLCPTAGGVIQLVGSALSLKAADNSDVAGFSIFYKYHGQEVVCDGAIQVSVDHLSCNAQPGGGINLDMYIKTAGGQSKTIPFGYIAPKMIDYYQRINGFYINGTNLGSVEAAVNVTANYGGTELTTVSYSDTAAGSGLEPPPIVYISTESQNAQMYLTVEGQKSNDILIDIKPTIDNITLVPTRGGIVTVNGYFFNTIDPKNITFLSGDVQCTNLTIVSTKQFYCNAPDGFGKNRPVTLRVNNKNTSTFDPIVDLSYQPPSIDSTTSANYTGGLITIVGSNFHIGSTNVTIGEEVPVNCEIRNIIDYNRIVCYLKKWNNDDGILKNETYLVTITVGDQSISKLDYKWGLEGYNYGISKEQPKKWLIAAIVIPVAAGVLAVGAIGFILYKKHLKFKKLQSMYKK